MKFTKHIDFSNGLDKDLYDELLNWCYEQKKQEFILTVEVAKNKRSLVANAFYWGVVLKEIVNCRHNNTASDFSDWVALDFHEALSERYLRDTNEKTGRTRTKSTSSLTVKEFNWYIDRVITDILINTFGGVIMEDDMHQYNKAMEVKK